MKLSYFLLGLMIGIWLSVGIIYSIRPAPADLNHDGKVSIEDWSIMDSKVFPPEEK